MSLSRTLWQLLVFTVGVSVHVQAVPVNSDACEASNNPTSSSISSSTSSSTSSCPQSSAQHLKFAVLGDSWASGVAYSSAVQYDDNSDGCLRTTEAYANHMKEDLNWASGKQYLEFPACSGSRLVDIVHGRCQICQLDDPSIIIMTIGGNDAQFADIAVNCIYQPDLKTDYGPDYADDTKNASKCARAINSTRSYIQDSEKGLAFDLTTTYDNMLDTDLIRNNPDVRIYHTGYAHFFNIDEEWCNEESFGALPGIVPGSHKPKLSQKLRGDVNDLVEQVNNVIQQTISTFSHSNFGFVDISPGFDGHRFCEAGGTHVGQYYSDDVWFWNLSYPWFGALRPTNSTDVNLDGPLFGSNSTTYSGSGNGNVAEGWRFRPFHPKSAGHEAIMNAVIAKLRADKVPGVSPS
jgi:hypothetical protein